MENVYIKTEDTNKWIAKYFNNKDLISIEDLLDLIEELDSDVEYLKDKIKEMEEPKEYENIDEILEHYLLNGKGE